MNKSKQPKTTSGVIAQEIKVRRSYIKAARTIEECCFHFAIGRSQHETAKTLGLIDRLRPEGLHRVERAFADLRSTWQNATSTILDSHPSDSDREELEAWGVFLSEMDSYCDSRYHGDFDTPTPS